MCVGANKPGGPFQQLMSRGKANAERAKSPEAMAAAADSIQYGIGGQPRQLNQDTPGMVRGTGLQIQRTQ